MIYARHLLLLAIHLTLLLPIFSQDCEQPQPGIQVCDNSVFCNGTAVCVENVTENPAGLTFTWEWPDTTYTRTEVGTETRVIRVDPACDPQERVQIFLTATRECDDGTTQSTTVSAFVTIVFPPTVSLPDDQLRTTFCLPDQEACFSPSICPTNPGIRTVSWEVSDGFTTTDESFCRDFPDIGSYEATITVESFASGVSCGVASETAEIEVFAEPVPRIEYDGELFPAGIMLPDDTLEACTGRLLNLLNRSESADSAVWTVSPGRNGDEFEVLTRNNDTLALNFSEAGTYTLELRAISTACNPPREGVCTHTIIVSESNSISFDLNLDDCEPLTISPREYLTVFGDDTNLEWVIQGDTIRQPDPGTFTFSESSVISVSLDTDCGFVQAEGTVTISTPGVGEIFEAGEPVGEDTLRLCIYDEPLVLHTLSSGGTWELDGIEQEVQEPDTVFQFDPAQADTGFHTISYGSECIVRDPIVVQVQGLQPTYEVSEFLCNDSPPVPFVATPNPGTWISDEGLITENGVFDPQASGPGAFVVRYEYQVGTCEFSDEFTIQVSELTVDFAIDTCQLGDNGTTVVFQGIFDIAGPDEISWDFGDGATGTGGEVSHEYLNPDTYSVTLEVSQGACNADTTKDIQIDEPPVAAFARTPADVFCAVESLSLTNESTGGSTYSWRLDDEEFSNEQNPTPLLLEAGPGNTSRSYDLTLIVQGGCGSDKVSESLEVLPEVKASFGAFPDTVCSGDTTFFNNNSLGISTTCQWILDGTPLSQACELAPQVFGEGPHVLTLELSSDICNRVDTFEKALLVKPAEVRAFFEPVPDEVCLGDSIQFVNFATPFSTIIWDFGDDSDLLNSGLGDTIVHVFQDTGRFEVTQYARGCGLDSISFPIFIRPLPEIDLAFDASVCQDAPLAVSVETGAENYEVRIGTQAYNNLIEFEHTADSVGTFSVSGKATNVYTCEATVQRQLTVHPSPDIRISPPDGPLCTGNEIQFMGVGEGPITQWQWNFGEGNGANVQQPGHTYDQAGEFEVTLIGASDRGCADTTSLSNVRVAETPVSNFVPSQLQACAPIENVSFLNLSEGVDIVSNTWEFNGMSSSVRNLLVDFEEPGTYPVVLTVENAVGCIDSYRDSIQVFPQPSASILFPEVSRCTPMEVPFSLEATEYTEIEWKVNGLPIDTAENFTYTFLAPDTTYNVQVELSYGGICTDTDLVEISPVQGAKSSFRFSNTKWDEAQVQLVNTSEYASDYLWDFGGETDKGPGSLEESPIITYLEGGEYTVTLFAFNGEGCADTFSLERTFYPIGPLFVPSAFTPNGDGTNDVFFVVSPVELRSFELEIFNRWGEMIYTSNDIEEGWDGILPGGVHASEGVYTFKCRAETLGGALAEPGSGTITIIR